MIRLYQSTLRAIPRRAAAVQQVLNTTHEPSMQKRFYLGDAGEMKSRRENAIDDVVAQREQELWDKAQPRYDAILKRHLRLPTVDDDEATTNNMSSKEERELDVRKKRLIYRSKQRGWLEVDLLLGTWASENVPRLSPSELDEFEEFVNLETIDIYNVITLRTDVPESMQSGVGGEKTLVEKSQDWAKESPLGKASREKYVEVKSKNNLI